MGVVHFSVGVVRSAGVRSFSREARHFNSSRCDSVSVMLGDHSHPVGCSQVLFVRRPFRGPHRLLQDIFAHF